MAKSENDETSPPWSTMEELLLAYAVHRHGIDSWDTVAAEIQKQNSSFRTLTAFDCRHKYYDLKRRFSRKLVSPEEEEGETVVAEISSVPWLEELRKLRVDELRREVERYDLSISSLQLKVKRLEDEREKSLKTEISDPDEIAEMKHESVINSGVPVTEPVNSPDPKENSPGIGSENTNRDVKIDEPSQIGDEDKDEKPAREDSCKGSCESVTKESTTNSDKAELGRQENDSPEFVESMDESKEAKETSDVQSSASLSRKETVEQNQQDNENQSLTVNKNLVESQPLIDFIETFQSHPIGCHFSRRLETKVYLKARAFACFIEKLQETLEYDKIVRQHIDFEMIRSRVEEGYYKISRSKFFRDLLLLINNLRVFYGESSSELYQLIKKQMSVKVPEETSLPKEESLVTSKEEATVSSLKPTLSVPMIACRKRSSLAVRPSSLGNELLKKKTKIVPEENPVSEEEDDETSDKDEEPIVSKKMTRGRTASAAKKVGSRNVKSNQGSVPKRSVQEKKGNNTIGGSKKQSAASFLKRMKGVSVSETVVETVKADSSNGKRGAELRKSNNKNDKVDEAKPPTGQRRLAGKKLTNEKDSPKEADSVTRPKKRSRR